MKNLKNEILLFSIDGESKIDGMTIKHCFKCEGFHNVIIFGFTDGSWGLIDDFSRGSAAPTFNWDNFKSNLSHEGSKIEKTLNHMAAAGALTLFEVALTLQEIKASQIKYLKEGIKSQYREIGRLEDRLAELET